jgi:hypothetical protein
MINIGDTIETLVATPAGNIGTKLKVHNHFGSGKFCAISDENKNITHNFEENEVGIRFKMHSVLVPKESVDQNESFLRASTQNGNQEKHYMTIPAVDLMPVDPRFASHTVDLEGVTKMRLVRKKVRELANLIDKSCPDSKEKATALTQLTFVMFSANSAISSTYPVDPAEL